MEWVWGLQFAPTWLRQASPLLHKTTLTTAPKATRNTYTHIHTYKERERERDAHRQREKEREDEGEGEWADELNRRTDGPQFITPFSVADVANTRMNLLLCA